MSAADTPCRNAIEELLELDREVVKLQQISGLLHWDLETQIPAGGVPQRAEQFAYLSGVLHEKAVSPRIGELLNTLTDKDGTPVPELDEIERGHVRTAAYDYQQQVKLPREHVETVSRVTSLANHAWVEARKNDDFAAFAPHLEKIVELNRQAAEYLGYREHPYDALLDRFEPGMTVSVLDSVFGRLREQLTDLVQRIGTAPQPRNDFLYRRFPNDRQLTLGRQMAADIGFDFERGVLAVAPHPFSMELSSDDIRITTRYDENYLPMALFGTIHETGHALYEQGFPEAIKNTSLASGTSLGIHESQSRFWENTVARSRSFWRRYYADLQRLFPEQLFGVDVETFYRGINVVRPSLIRVEADEVTYGLHVIVRYEIEKELITGRLRVAELPEAWNSRMEALLGIRPDSDHDGVLQDVHWSHGAIGYFPTYALGNLYAAQCTEAMERELGPLSELIEGGRFAAILDWQRRHIHRHGRGKLPLELLRDITGQELQAQPFIDSLTRKFGEIYQL